MRTRGRNRLVIEQDDDEDVRPYIEHLMDGQNHSATQPYIEQLMDNQNSSKDKAHDDQSCDLNSSAGGTEVQQNDDESALASIHDSTTEKLERDKKKNMQNKLEKLTRLLGGRGCEWRAVGEENP
ncbi:hypothetical protein A4A49_54095 [Nicotiana attenuata]|uniref:Uncharacterized protein n=1 Tax=Nicotiana attenuata TaxID=49451 RepID=A0A1J6J944_NICAT|nr:hypothetical protein A4A49_54095 [Nicotiana attenuata]